MKRSAAEILREYGPFPGVDRVHGVTFDGQHVWFASGDKLNAFDPASGKTLRSIDVAAHAGTAFDGQHLFQIAEDRIQKIDPKTGRVLATIPAPGGGGDSGLAWAEGTLWVGQYRDRKIHQIDPQTGAILRTIESNRFVTGVTWVDGELWHGTWEGDESDLRRVDPRTGEVLERLEMPPGVGVSGLESDGGDQFFCGGGSSGKVRAVRRPRRVFRRLPFCLRTSPAPPHRAARGHTARGAGGGRRPVADRENRKHPVADEFKHLAAEGVNGAGDAVEPGVERGDHRLRRNRLGQSREIAQIAKEQHRADGLACRSPQPPRQHLRRAASAEISLEQCCQRRPRRQHGERRRGETFHLRSSADSCSVSGRKIDQPSSGPSCAGPATSFCTTAPPSRVSQSRPTSRCPGPAEPKASKPSASITTPVSARHSQVRLAIIGCGAASVRAPPASGKSSAISCAPSAARKWSALSAVLASSSSHARVLGNFMRGPCGRDGDLSPSHSCQSRRVAKNCFHYRDALLPKEASDD